LVKGFADFIYFGLYINTQMVGSLDKTIWEKYPHIKKWSENFKELPNIKAYYDSERGKTKPQLPPFAKIQVTW